jgi:hypothetical protein
MRSFNAAANAVVWDASDATADDASNNAAADATADDERLRRQRRECCLMSWLGHTGFLHPFIRCVHGTKLPRLVWVVFDDRPADTPTDTPTDAPIWNTPADAIYWRRRRRQ